MSADQIKVKRVFFIVSKQNIKFSHDKFCVFAYSSGTWIA